MDKFKSAFNNIVADNELKQNTLLYLRGVINKRRRKVYYFFALKLTIVIVLSFFTGLLSLGFYFTPDSYIDFDINPSIELRVNKFGRVIRVHAYNSYGDDIISNLPLKHTDYLDAVNLLVEKLEKHGYIKEDALLTITLQTDRNEKETELLSDLKNKVETITNGKTQLDIFLVEDETLTHAHEINMSPAKYLAITEFMDIDPTVTFEGCRNHSIKEIRQFIIEHGGDCCRDNDNTSVTGKHSARHHHSH